MRLTNKLKYSKWFQQVLSSNTTQLKRILQFESLQEISRIHIGKILVKEEVISLNLKISKDMITTITINIMIGIVDQAAVDHLIEVLTRIQAIASIPKTGRKSAQTVVILLIIVFKHIMTQIQTMISRFLKHLKDGVVVLQDQINKTKTTSKKIIKIDPTNSIEKSVKKIINLVAWDEAVVEAKIVKIKTMFVTNHKVMNKTKKERCNIQIIL